MQDNATNITTVFFVIAVRPKVNVWLTCGRMTHPSPLFPQFLIGMEQATCVDSVKTLNE
ncbi:hypothetical protein SXCC_03017 [Gluconacetobacter sp. SXCC-1]|nr:hypothetical protein SXCC_03017 [Gluconacetobacter sp. SXCC-1]